MTRLPAQFLVEGYVHAIDIWEIPRCLSLKNDTVFLPDIYRFLYIEQALFRQFEGHQPAETYIFAVSLRHNHDAGGERAAVADLLHSIREGDCVLAG